MSFWQTNVVHCATRSNPLTRRGRESRPGRPPKARAAPPPKRARLDVLFDRQLLHRAAVASLRQRELEDPVLVFGFGLTLIDAMHQRKAARLHAVVALAAKDRFAFLLFCFFLDFG